MVQPGLVGLMGENGPICWCPNKLVQVPVEFPPLEGPILPKTCARMSKRSQQMAWKKTYQQQYHYENQKPLHFVLEVSAASFK